MKEAPPIQYGLNYEKARNMTHEEIIAWFDNLTKQHDTALIRKMSVSFSAESRVQKKREILPTVSSYLILNRKGDLRMQIMDTIVGTTRADIMSRGDIFALWYPQDKTVYKGSIEKDLDSVTLSKADDAKSPIYNLKKLRPWHITQTFFHYRQGGDKSKLIIIQEDTLQERYYVIHEVGRNGLNEEKIWQTIWLERASIKIRRKVMYDDSGAPLSDITYNYDSIAGLPDDYPSVITMKRPQEGYQSIFTIKKIQFDIELKASMFDLATPKEAKEKSISSLSNK